MQINLTKQTQNAVPLTTGGTNSPAGSDTFAKLMEGSDPAAMLRDMTKDGVKSMWKWQLEQLKKKVADQVMKEMGVTPESLAKMDVKSRMGVEDKIMKEVERRVKEMVDSQMAQDHKNPFGTISAATPSARAPTQDYAKYFDIVA